MYIIIYCTYLLVFNLIQDILDAKKNQKMIGIVYIAIIYGAIISNHVPELYHYYHIFIYDYLFFQVTNN